MNKTYRSVWNESTGVWTAAQENARGRSKSASTKTGAVVSVAMSAAVAALALSASMQARAQFAGGGGVLGPANKGDGVSIGYLTNAVNGYSIGSWVTTTGNWSIGFGHAVTVTGQSNIGIGTDVLVIGTDAIALGNAANAYGSIGSTALGSHSLSSNSYATALGDYAQATGLSATALGYNARASTTNSVALGANSLTGSATRISGDTIGGNYYMYAGTAPVGVVSVGSAGAERQIMNVAAGRVASNSTDAVNGSQLYATNQALTDLAGKSTNAVLYDSPSQTSVTLGGVGSRNPVALRNVANGALTASSLDAVNGSQLYATNERITSLDGKLQDAVLYDSSSHNSVTLGGSGSTKSVALHNVANGALTASSLDAVNGSQLYATNERITSLDGKLQDAVLYDSSSHNSVTLGGSGSTKSVALHNVANGALNPSSLDAVNGSQLYDAMQQAGGKGTHYVGINSLPDQGNYNGEGAIGDSAIAIGANATASGYHALAIGTGATTTAATGTAIGHNTLATEASVALGASSSATTWRDVAIGPGSAANGGSSIAIGSLTTAAGYHSMALGGGAIAQDSYGIALGDGAIAAGQASAAFGPAAAALGGNDVAIGFQSTSSGAAAIAIGTGASANGVQSTAIGAGATTTGDAATAIGVTSVAEGNGTAVGLSTYANWDSTAVGESAKAAGGTSMAVGYYATAGNLYAVALGPASNAGGSDATAIGHAAQAGEGSATAVGANTLAASANALALGAGATASQSYAVALGSGSTTDAAVGTLSTTIRGVSYDFAGGNPASTVSIGSVGNERTISNVAAGRLSLNSTDAVNGSQLYATNQAIQNFKLPYIDGTGTGAPAQATGLSSVALGYGSVADKPGTVSVGSPTLTRRITNVADAQSDTDAVNYGQVKDLFGIVTPDSTDPGSRVSVNTADSATLDAASANSHRVLAAAAPSSSTGASSADATTDALALHYDSSSHASVTLSSTSGGNVQLTGLQNASLADGSTDAVTGQQLFATNQQLDNLNQAVQNISTTGSFAVATNTTSGAAAASGTQSLAVGGGAAATGNSATAIGDKASASADNSVAIGANSIANRANAVSVGAEGAERQIVNVAAGTSGTDAVNLNQLNNAITQQSNAFNQQITGLQNSINTVSKNAYAGVAAAMAMPNLTPSGPGRTVVAAGGGYYMGGSAAAVGVTYRSVNMHWLVNGGVSVTSTGNTAARAQVGYEF
ncbi:ESPR-type extended signal peptide-containing protein [Paraburkholderia unamae]|uniref:Autotransporter adhesin n=1 Tax=Paraburkholderia unamae TaxID=219649 RepID=A0ABX5KQV0_9BURK|nr:ESPR-type extended signal peptide-containing protein [Paraburkholderia unamae]PVX83176.1 autotransporter adhesin [Paraburkholderia unamae]